MLAIGPSTMVPGIGIIPIMYHVSLLVLDVSCRNRSPAAIVVIKKLNEKEKHREEKTQINQSYRNQFRSN